MAKKNHSKRDSKNIWLFILACSLLGSYLYIRYTAQDIKTLTDKYDQEEIELQDDLPATSSTPEQSDVQTTEATEVQQTTQQDRLFIDNSANIYGVDGKAAYSEQEKLKQKELAPDWGAQPKVEGYESKILDRRKRQLSEFQQQMRLDMQLPLDLNYHSLDFDDGVIALRGKGDGQIQTLTAMGTKKNYNTEQLIHYLNSPNNGIVENNQVRFNTEGTQRFVPNKDSGISDIVVIDGNHRGVKAAHVIRADGQASYLFVIEGDGQYFEDNQDGIASLLSRIRAN
jgi:hypothetical protein